jgi:osmoprotectant transport system substrate-binding protein
VACGDDDSGSSGGDESEGRSGATGELTNVDFEGASITVGSKDFDENILLGTILATALEEAGADVTDSTNTGGTNVAREALLNGDIDVYPEYNGTGWTRAPRQRGPLRRPDRALRARP